MLSFFKRSHQSSAARRKSGYRLIRPRFEALETREVLSTSAFSNLANLATQFNLTPQGHVLMTQGGAQTDLGGGVQ